MAVFEPVLNETVEEERKQLKIAIIETSRSVDSSDGDSAACDIKESIDKGGSSRLVKLIPASSDSAILHTPTAQTESSGINTLSTSYSKVVEENQPSLNAHLDNAYTVVNDAVEAGSKLINGIQANGLLTGIFSAIDENPDDDEILPELQKLGLPSGNFSYVYYLFFSLFLFSSFLYFFYLLLIFHLFSLIHALSLMYIYLYILIFISFS